jgi:transcription elongation factor Elf1
MAPEACPKCGSTKTVRHSPDAGLKPNWLHCNGCAHCAPYEVPKRTGRGTKADAGDSPSDDAPADGAPPEAKQDEANDTTHAAGKKPADKTE